MNDQEAFARRELVVRVATLELLVADLVHIVRQCAPAALDELAAEAVRDVDLQNSREMPCGAETQRFRLRQVLDSRARSLARRRFSSRLAVHHCAATD